MGVCLTALTSCGVSENGSKDRAGKTDESALSLPEQPTVKDVPKVESKSMPVLPIEKYLPKVGEDARIAAASGEFIRVCMARFGYRYRLPAISQNALDSQENGANRGRRYGVSNAAYASTYGYHLPKDEPRNAPPADIPPMSEAENKVFIGDQDPTAGVKPGDKVAGQEIPSGGCSGEAQRKLKIEPRERMAEKINNVSFARSQENKQVKKALNEWSACMARSGHAYKTPLEPLDNIKGESAGAVEVSAAQADVACKDSVNLVGTWFSIESKIQEELIARSEEILADDSKSFDALVRRASDEIAKSR